MKNQAKMNNARLDMIGKLVLRDESLKGRIDLEYMEGMGQKKYKLRVRTYIKSDQSDGIRIKENSKGLRRKFTFNDGQKVKIGQVAPLYEPRVKENVVMSEYFRNVQFQRRIKRKLNEVGVISGRDTNAEEENLIMNVAKFLPVNQRDLFNSNLCSFEFDLTPKINKLLELSDNNILSIDFELELNNNVPVSMKRPFNLVTNINFEEKREDMIQTVVYKRAKTILGNEGYHYGKVNDMDSEDKNEEEKHERSISVVNMVEVLCDSIVVATKEITVLENPSIYNKPKIQSLTGSIPYGFKGLLCFKKPVYTNYIFCLSDNRIWTSRKSLAFTFRAQYSLLRHLTYIDFKVIETIVKSNTMTNETTIFGNCIHLSKKKFSKSDKLDSYFEFVNNINLNDFKAENHIGLACNNMKITHTLKVYLSNWPYTFRHKVGEIDLEITKVAHHDELMDLISSHEDILSPNLSLNILKFSLSNAKDEEVRRMRIIEMR